MLRLARRAGTIRYRPVLWTAVTLLLPALAACGSESSGPGKPKSAPYTTTEELSADPVVTTINNLVKVTAETPVKSLAMGLVAQGTDTDQKFIEHAGLWLGGVDSMLGPDGAVPYAFPRFDLDGNGSLESPLPIALEPEAVALHFPNDGFEKHTLPSGSYQFPVGAIDADGFLVVDTLTPYVYYKLETSERTTLKLNVFVVAGISAGITNQASAVADPEIQGALQVLQNVYRENANVDILLDITITFINDPALAELDSEAEHHTMFQDYPASPTHDAMNIFIISSLEYDDPGNPGTGIIGRSAGIPGPFNRHGTATSGTVAEYQDDGDGTILGFTLAHEFGHFLGLFHTSQTSFDEDDGEFVIVGKDTINDTERCKNGQVQQSGDIDNCPDRGNLMFPFVDDVDDPEVSIGQGNVIKFNPGITVP